MSFSELSIIKCGVEFYLKNTKKQNSHQNNKKKWFLWFYVYTVKVITQIFWFLWLLEQKKGGYMNKKTCWIKHDSNDLFLSRLPP